jgi:hypothetical protein
MTHEYIVSLISTGGSFELTVGLRLFINILYNAIALNTATVIVHMNIMHICRPDMYSCENVVKIELCKFTPARDRLSAPPVVLFAIESGNCKYNLLVGFDSISIDISGNISGTVNEINHGVTNPIFNRLSDHNCKEIPLFNITKLFYLHMFQWKCHTRKSIARRNGHTHECNTAIVRAQWHC